MDTEAQRLTPMILRSITGDIGTKAHRTMVKTRTAKASLKLFNNYYAIDQNSIVNPNF